MAVAARNAKRIPLGDGLLILEIGGNDLLGSTTAENYERNLDELLSAVCQPGRAAVMFELPLPPFRNEFGRIQRRLANQYGVELIPKRVLIGVLTGEGSTTDSIHLSPRGHEEMAETVWRIIMPAYEP